jgi:uncharacterized YigZ family protein
MSIYNVGIPLVKAYSCRQLTARFVHTLARPVRTLRNHHGSLLSSSSSSTETIKSLEVGSSTISELEVKKSKFIGYASPVGSWDDAVGYIARVKQEHPKARHVCHGFKCGSNERCSDDGEPSGTAGLPILGAIKGEEITNVVCVVVRYFGGIKLGAGGLIRAYGAAARQVLREAPVVFTTPKNSIQVTVVATFIGAVYETAAKASATTSGEDYDADGSLTLTLTCDATIINELVQSLTDATRGEVIIAGVAND